MKFSQINGHIPKDLKRASRGKIKSPRPPHSYVLNNLCKSNSMLFVSYVIYEQLHIDDIQGKRNICYGKLLTAEIRLIFRRSLRRVIVSFGLPKYVKEL
jgi:hypothetical protein